jgi:nitroreductase
MLEILQKRQSVRKFTGAPVKKSDVKKILEAGVRAPSGKNGQPWRFAVIQDDKELLRQVAAYTIYEDFVRRADCLLCVFMDKTQSYHYIKDCQAIGACIQNMLLEAADIGLGACWIGEILNADGAVKQLLGVGNRYDLMAVIAVGVPSGENARLTPRKPLEECVLFYR